jgi:5'-nucleotidase (lipoprotein e(P4) family)
MKNRLLILIALTLPLIGQNRAAAQAVPTVNGHLIFSNPPATATSSAPAPATTPASNDDDDDATAPVIAKTIPGAHEQLDAALWVQTSAEFYGIARQTFASATEKADLALRDPTWTAATEQFAKGHYQDLPPAVIVNLDETVWSNSPYQARIILEYGQHDMEHFIAWCNEAKCTAIPGAKEFLEHVKRQGITITYVTPRPEMTRDGTLKNLAQLGYPYDPQQDQLLMEGAWPNHDKRESIGQQHRILLIVSDYLGDFMHDTAQDPAVRREMAGLHADNWGLKWFLIPNPMYGHWEYSFQHYDYNLDRSTRLQNKLRALNPEEDAQLTTGRTP